MQYQRRIKNYKEMILYDWAPPMERDNQVTATTSSLMEVGLKCEGEYMPQGEGGEATVVIKMAQIGGLKVMNYDRH